MANRCTSSADAFALLGTKAKSNGPWRSRPTTLAVALAGAFAAGAALAQTLPTGGVAIHGQASISKPAPNQLVVTTQNGAGTGHSAINWQSFSLSAGTSAQFIQPGANSLSINRVVTPTPSAIFGNLSSNGRLVLVNQSGITVGAGAVVDTAGFTASALRMTDADALAGRLRFGTNGGVDALGGGAGLTVDGRITARDGDVVLIAPHIGMGTSALVQAPSGSTILAAGQQVEITGRGLEGISLLVQAREHEARNLGRLEGGAVGIFAGTLRHSGEIQATTATLDGGTIVLKASDDAYVEGGGKLQATGGRGGGIDVLGHRVAVTDQALVDASGRIGGGNIRVGGDFQGKNPAVPNADKTFLGPQASLHADATDAGNGGRVIVWADNQTQAYGSISARGGPSSGDGGFVEVSGKKTLAFAAIVDTRASHGLTGTLLLDPRHIIVAIAGAAANPSDVDQFADLPGSTQTVSPATLNAIGGNVVLQATENINFNDPLNLATLNASLTALAGGIITVDAAINTNQGDVTLYANAPGSGGPGPSGSAVRMNASVNSNGGNVVLRSDGSAAAISLLLNGNVSTGAGSLALVGGGGLISQTAGSVTVGGPSTINAGSSDALLGVTSNDFSSVDITAAHITLVDANALTVTSRSQLANSNLYLQAGGTLSVPAGAINTGTAQLSLLSGAGGLTTPGALSGSDILLSGATNLTLAHNVTASGNMTLLSGGSMLQSAGTMSTAAGSMGVNAAGNLTVQGGAGALTQMRAVGDQTITAFGVQVLGGTGGSNASAAIASTGAGSSQSITVTGGANFIIAGGSGAGSGNSAIVSSAGIAQTVTFLGGGNLQVNGGSVGTSHHAELISSAGGSTQTVTGAGGITVTGGTSGGGLGVGNYARIAGFGDQIIDVDSGGLTLVGGSGTGIETGNSANVEHNGGPGTRQDITVNGSGFISLTGGSSALTGVGDGNGSHASIRSDLGDSQMIDFSGSGVGRTISLTGGTVGSDAYAEIYAGAGTQDITGARQITLTGGASGGGATDAGGNTHGNLAVINAEFGTQTIIANGIALLGGAGGTNNLAGIVAGADQFITVGNGGLALTGGGGSSLGELKNAAIVFKINDVAGTRQTITVGGGGSITLQGGTANPNPVGVGVGVDANLENLSNGAFASIRSDGIAQLIEFTAVGGSIAMTGGILGSDNHAKIEAISGTQTIRGDIAAHAPAISLFGGASGGLGGAINEGNRALIIAVAGNQDIAASSINLTGGATGNENVAQLRQGDTTGAGNSSTQTITIKDGGDLTMLGGGGNFNVARVRSHGTAQRIQFSAPGSNISLTGGGAGTDNLAQIVANNGSQTIEGLTAADAPTISLQGGNSGVGNLAELMVPLGSQTIEAASIAITGGAAGTDNMGRIAQNGSVGFSQSITIVGGGAVNLQGGGGTTNLAQFRSQGDMQTVNFASGGTLTLTGGTGASLNFARVEAANGSQSISGAPGITIVGGASGGATGLGNFAQIRARTAAGTQLVSASSLTIRGGAAGVENDAGIRNDAAQTVTLNGAASSNAIVIGDSAAANVSFITGNSQVITAGTGAQSGSITIRGGTEAGKNNGIFNNVGAQTVSTSGGLSITGGTAVGSASTCNTLTGGACAMISNNGAALQTITTGASALIQGGNSGIGNGAGIFVNAGDLVLNVNGGDLILTGGTGTGFNFASIGGSGSSGRTQTFNVVGNVTLDASSASDNSSAFIGLGSTGDLGSTIIDINSGGNVTLMGSNVSAISGAAIGAGASQTNATATVSIDAANIVLNAGSASGARIGHGAAANGPGNVTLTATGNVAFNSNGTVGTGIRTTGNATINAGGSITEGTSSLVSVNLLTASAGVAILLDSPLNQVGSLNATLPFFDTGDMFFTNATGTTLAVTGVTMAGSKTARITADDLNITGPVSNGGGRVVLRPLDLTRNVHIESSPSGGVLSLSPADLQQVSASVLDIGRLDGTGDLVMQTGLSNGNINAGMLRPLTGNNFVGDDLGSVATPFNHDVEIRANNHVFWLNGNVFLGDNQQLKAFADNDGTAVGNVSIDSSTLKVGAGSGNTTGLMDIKGAGILVSTSGAGATLLEVTGSGAQTLTATDLNLVFGNGNTVGGNLQVRTNSGTQTLSAALGTLILQPGTGTGTSVSVGATSGSQFINADALLLTGGGSGFGNSSFLFAGGAAQTITLNGGALNVSGGSGTGADGNNSAIISYSGTGAQNITVNGGGNLVISGGSSALPSVGAGDGSRAIIESTGTGNQAITLTGGGMTGGGMTLQGGSVGASNFARVQAFGASQTITLSAGAALNLTGGTGASFNFARIQAVNGNQTIAGSPNIGINGGASGGADLAGNFADVRASGPASLQSIAANNIVLQAGAAGQENFAGILAPNQTITALGNVLLTGGGSLTSLNGTSGGGARIGGFGGGAPSATNLNLTVGNDLVLTGGSVAGASLGSGRLGNQTTNIIVDATGGITLNPGSVATAGSRIGSPASGLAGGDIFLAAGGSISLGGALSGETAVRTLGDVTLDAATLNIGNLVAGATLFATATGAIGITGPGQLVASALAGDSLEVVTDTSFSNSAGASALLVTAPARWLVYSNDPAADTRGALALGFKQYAKTFGDANPILGSGNGFLYLIAPTATVSLTGSVTRVYDGTNVATLAAGNFLASGGIDGDAVSVSSGATGNYDTRHVGTGKTVSVSGVTLSALDGAVPVFGYALAGGTASGAIGAITAAPLSVSTAAVSKSYDASLAAPGAGAIVTAGALLGGDTLSGGTFAFLDPTVGTGKTVSVSGVTVNDGNGGLNYTLTQAGNTVSSITALAAANWSGLGGNSLWSNPANWDVLPLTGNVLSVAIPAGAGTVVFDAAAGTTSLQSLSSQQPISVTGGNLVLGTNLDTPSLSQSGGNLQVGSTLTAASVSQSAGTMQVGGSLIAGNFSQTGGAISGTGALTVANSFSQSGGGSVSMGSILVNQSSGNLVFANLSAPSITLSAPTGMIAQTGPINGAAVSTASLSGTQLNNPSNQIGTLVALNNGSGNIALVNSGALVIGAMANAGGNIDLTNTGAIATAGPVSAPAGDVTIIANSPLTVGAGGIIAGGSVVLHATNLTSAGNLTLDGAVLAGNTVSLTADSNFVQNFAVVGGNGVTASAGGSMTFGPFATTNAPPILYTAGGLPVPPPPAILASALQPPGDILLTFLDLLDDVINGPLGDALETNPDGSRKKRDLEGIVTEGEICR